MVQPVLCSSPERLVAAAKAKGLAQSRYWHLLLHYRRNLYGIYRSEVNDPAFFLSKTGRKDPQAELDATLRAFYEPPPVSSDTQHPQCRFPARLAWLREQLGADAADIPLQPCARYDEWRSQMDVGSVSVVFAASYLNNPASVYGHTFLRLNKRGRGDDQELLDYTVNYAADVTTFNPLFYVTYGLMGGFRGTFSTMPYYLKVQEYNNLESRDLWDYDLSISSAGIARLVPHLWEMGGGSMSYFFFNRNCSYQLMPLLEVTQPSLHLKDGFTIRTVPSDTLRVIMRQPGLVRSVRRRPSLVTRLMAERKALTPEEIHQVETILENPDSTSGASAQVLETALDLHRYRVGFSRDLPKEVYAKEEKLLLLRNKSQNPLPPGWGKEGMGVSTAGSNPPPHPSPTRGEGVVPPHSGHLSGRLGLAYGFSNRSRFEEVSLRPALHDLDDQPEGYLAGSQIQLFNTRVRFDHVRDQFYLQEFTIANAMALVPIDRWIRHLSWKINTGLTVATDLPKDPEHALYYGLNFGSGGTIRTWADSVLAYAMVETDLGAGMPFDQDYRAGFGGESGLAWRPFNKYQMRFQGNWRRYPVGHVSGVTKLQLIQSLTLSDRAQLRATLEKQNSYEEVLLGLNLYF